MTARAAGIVLVLILASAAHAALSPMSGFVLIARVAPGLDTADAVGYLGEPAVSRDLGGTLRARWGGEEDDWVFDIEARDGRIFLSSVTWRPSGPRDARALFARLTSAGREFFGQTASYRTPDEAYWRADDDDAEVSLKISVGAVSTVVLTSSGDE